MNKKIFFLLTIIIVILIILLVLCQSRSCSNGENEKFSLLGDSSLSKIKKSGKLVVGTYEQIEPMSFLDENGENIGYDIDIAQKIADKLGVFIEIKEMFFTELFEEVKAGGIDIIVSSITITHERQEEMLFSIPYFNAGQVMIVKTDNDAIKMAADLAEKKIGVYTGTTGEKMIEGMGHINPRLVTSYKNKEQLLKDLKEGKIDVLIEDYTGGTGVVKNNSSLKMLDEFLTKEFYGVVTKIDNESLMSEINKVLRDMKKNDEFKELDRKWYR